MNTYEQEKVILAREFRKAIGNLKEDAPLDVEFDHENEATIITIGKNGAHSIVYKCTAGSDDDNFYFVCTSHPELKPVVS